MWVRLQRVTVVNPSNAEEKDVYEYDAVISGSANQVEVAELITPRLLLSLTSGPADNAMVVAYGTTSSGKTHTMMGSEKSPGLLHSVITNLSRGIGSSSLQVSLVEAYHDRLRDLLLDDDQPSPGSSRRRILHSHPPAPNDRPVHSSPPS